jgi:hypothetical protein
MSRDPYDAGTTLHDDDPTRRCGDVDALLRDAA